MIIGENNPCKNLKLNAHKNDRDIPNNKDNIDVVTIPINRTGFLPHLSQRIPHNGDDKNLPIIIAPPIKPTQYPVLLRLSTRPKCIIILLAIGNTTANIKEFVKTDIYMPNKAKFFFEIILAQIKNFIGSF